MTSWWHTTYQPIHGWRRAQLTALLALMTAFLIGFAIAGGSMLFLVSMGVFVVLQIYVLVQRVRAGRAA
jgi:hypothetical protein